MAGSSFLMFAAALTLQAVLGIAHVGAGNPEDTRALDRRSSAAAAAASAPAAAASAAAAAASAAAAAASVVAIAGDCSGDQFKCTDGECIPADYRCDGFYACRDASDEIGCQFDTCRSIHETKCGNDFKCIPSPWVCDDVDDCHDGWDEKHCTNYWINLALNKPAEQSSTLGPYSADLAVDGNRDSNLNQASSSCSMTGYHPTGTMWWRVDLQDNFQIHAVKITNRGDCCGDRLKNFMVSVSHNIGELGHTCAHETSIAQGATVEYRCKEKYGSNLNGHYVTVTMPAEGYLALCEVEVLGNLPWWRRPGPRA